MLACTECQIQYEAGKKFCSHCGNRLVRIEETTPALEENKEARAKNTDRPMICPGCSLSFETGKYCRECGSPLVKKRLRQEKTEGKEQAKEAEPKRSLICPKCKMIYETGRFCRKCGATLAAHVPPPELGPSKPEPLTEMKKEPLSTQASEQKPVKNLPGEIEKRPSPTVGRRSMFSPLPIGIGGAVVLIVVAGFFLWPQYSHLIKKAPSSSAGPISKGDATPASPSTSSIPSTPSVPDARPSQASTPEFQEAEKIKSLLETIRQANLQKNIDLFMSCYSLDFKDRAGRREAALDTWKEFDYLDLLYQVKDQSISNDTASARVEWSIRISPKGGNQTEEKKIVIDVTFKKDEGRWKIRETKQAG
jgi:rRNA maturation endonuclease Nob1